MARYDTIGHGYANKRREDPRLRTRIHNALGTAQSVVNVGAGTGSYEPRDRHVIAIEPSVVMAAQRGQDRPPAIRASAGALPLHDKSVDAAMTILSLHHWDRERETGVRELRRVSRGPIIVLTIDPAVSGRMWLMRDYLPEVAALDNASFPAPEQIAEWLGGAVRIDVVSVPRNTPDWMLVSYWAHPERVLDPQARAATSGLARMDDEVIERTVTRLTSDLQTGEWHRRNSELKDLTEYDAGLRLLIAEPAGGPSD